MDRVAVVVGPPGSGKTTLCRALCGAWTPGVPVGSAPRAAHRWLLGDTRILAWDAARVDADVAVVTYDMSDPASLDAALGCARGVGARRTVVVGCKADASVVDSAAVARLVRDAGHAGYAETSAHVHSRSDLVVILKPAIDRALAAGRVEYCACAPS